jgi:UDP-glucose 4-epimerase
MKLKENILVTGGAGFIGSHVARHCLAAGHNVIVLDDLSGGFEDHLPEGVTFIHGSITDQQLVETLFNRYKFDYVYHLAAYAAEGLSHFIRNFNYTNNLIGSINLINESVKHKVKCFVFTSSIAVYGAGQLPMTESMTPVPEDPYGISKYAVELDLKTAHEMFGLNYIIFRPHNVYGENQNIGDKYRNVIGIFMNQIMQGKPLTIFGDGTQTRAFSYIDDVAIPIAKSVYIKEAYNEIFNIGADKPYSVKELAEVVSSALGVKPDIRFLAARNEVLHAYSDHSKAHKVFGAPSGIDLQTGILKMAAWARKTGARQSKEFDNIEIEEKLPEGWQIRKPIVV